MSSEDAATRDDGGQADLPQGFDQVRAEVSEWIDSGQRSRAREKLDAVAQTADTGRELEDNLWLYRILGWLNEEDGQAAEAAEAYRRAFELDPTELSVLRSLVEFVLEQPEDVESEWAVQPLQTALVQHTQSLDDEMRAAIHRRLGELWEQRGDSERASAHFDQAMEASRGDAEALEALLDALVAVGEPTDIIELRRQLIESLESARERAEALIELGDDWLERFNDPGRAIGAYEDAIVEDAENRRAYERIAKVGGQSDDWEHAYRATVQLSRLADDDPEAADYLVDAAEMARDRLWEPEKALDSFRQALDLDPSRFDEAFKPITAILLEAEDWEGLERAYSEAIELQNKREDVDDELIAVLWYKLADVYRLHLDEPGQAIEAYGAAAELFPNNPEFHRQAAQLAEDDSEYADAAIRHLRKLTELEPNNNDVVERLGRAYLRRGDVDRALWHFRVLDYRGESLVDKAREFLDRLERSIYKSPEHPLGEELRRDYVYPEGLDPNISEVFRILFPVLQNWTAERRSEYDLGRKDQVDLEEPLAFNNIYGEVGASLQFQDLPEVWRKSEQAGAMKVSLADRALIVGDDLLGSGNEKDIAFTVARKLILSMKPFYLVGLRPMSDLQAFFLLALQLVNPEVEFDRSEHMQQAFKKIKKQVTGERREALGRAVDAVTDGGTRDVVLGNWTEAIEDAANRVGLIFCDDLQVCARHIHNEPQPFSERSPRERVDDLVDWSTSDDFLELRERLGTSIS